MPFVQALVALVAALPHTVHGRRAPGLHHTSPWPHLSTMRRFMAGHTGPF
jgi:hypothetical protein